MTAYLCSIGTALPAYSIEQSDAARVAQDLGITHRWRKALPALYQKSGVRRRGSVLLHAPTSENAPCQSFYQPTSPNSSRGPSTSDRMQAYSQHAGPLLEKACLTALQAAKIAPSQITHLVTVSCTGFFSPGIDHWLMQQLAMPFSLQRTHVGFMGCHGLVNGLRVAQSITESKPDALVMVGAVELCSLHQQYTEDPQQLVANALFADGAACAMVAGERFSDGHATSHWQLAGSHSCMIPDTIDHMGWLIGDHGFQMRLSPEVPGIIASHLRPAVDAWLQELGLHRGDIDLWAIHPGGPRILDAVESSLELNQAQMQPSRHVLAEYGNMSSPTVLFILEHLQATSNDARHCMMVAFGPGLHAEMILLTNPRSIDPRSSPAIDRECCE